MDFRLDNFQNHFSPDRIAAAQDLVHQVGPIQWPFENTVLAEVDSEETYEVLIDIEIDDIIAFSCTCDQSYSPCLHTLAVLLLLSKEDDLGE